MIGGDSSGRQNWVGLTRGLPGSGKSSLARLWVQQDPEGRVRINRDDLRAELPHGKTACQGARE
ncbi:AAA family ATPase [Rhodococcus opacus]|uniref:AAA family ATPase n=1 Tax=Rhodococcus opacus TaxID=37919 RepID=UPI0037C570C3